jgi:hypothetical protein
MPLTSVGVCPGDRDGASLIAGKGDSVVVAARSTSDAAVAMPGVWFL